MIEDLREAFRQHEDTMYIVGVMLLCRYISWGHNDYPADQVRGWFAFKTVAQLYPSTTLSMRDLDSRVLLAAAHVIAIEAMETVLRSPCTKRGCSY